MKLIHLIIICFIIFTVSCESQSKHFENSKAIENEKRLIGKWQSDRKKTLDWIKNNRKLSKEKIENLDAAVKFGTMIVEISEDSTRYTYEGETTVEPNRIIGATSNTVAFIEKNPLTEEEEIRLVRIEDENTYSIYVDWMDIKEYFKKIE